MFCACKSLPLFSAVCCLVTAVGKVVFRLLINLPYTKRRQLKKLKWEPHIFDRSQIFQPLRLSGDKDHTHTHTDSRSQLFSSVDDYRPFSFARTVDWRHGMNEHCKGTLLQRRAILRRSTRGWAAKQFRFSPLWFYRLISKKATHSQTASEWLTDCQYVINTSPAVFVLRAQQFHVWERDSG